MSLYYGEVDEWQRPGNCVQYLETAVVFARMYQKDTVTWLGERRTPMIKTSSLAVNIVLW